MIGNAQSKMFCSEHVTVLKYILFFYTGPPDITEYQEEKAQDS